LFLAGLGAVHALEVEEYRATAVEVAGGTATLLSHESFLFGLSCRSGPVGDLPNLRQVKLGDTITLKDYSFRVGLIEVTRFLDDASWGGNTIAKKGDIVCVLAADERALPSDDDCEALWVRIPKCRSVR
ncbi:MAG: hypothetical protein V3T23_03390, partial [Nitrososphaerales archaeon]